MRGQQTKDLRFPASIRTDFGFKIRFKSARSAQANSALKIQTNPRKRSFGRNSPSWPAVPRFVTPEQGTGKWDESARRDRRSAAAAGHNHSASERTVHSEVDRRMGRRILSRSVHLRKFLERHLAGGSMALLRNRAAASGDVMNLIRSRATVSFFETLRTATPKWPYSISSGGKGPR